jgi:GAF domain-containing protein
MQARPRPIDRGSASGRAVLEGGIVHIEDVLSDSEFTLLDAQKLGHFRTVLAVPLLREGTAIGALFLTRPEIEPFTQNQIDLLTTFADQAVIAIENARLFDEVQARTREVQESLEYQTAISDVLAVISRSPNCNRSSMQSCKQRRACARRSTLFFGGCRTALTTWRVRAMRMPHL